MTIELKPGVELKNGAILLLSKPTEDIGIDVVLALYEGQYATWSHYKSDGLCRGGDYFGKDLEAAVKGFNARK